MASHLLRVHKSYRLVVAICDRDIYGKRFEEGDRVLDVSTDFYNGEIIDSEILKEEIFELLREDATFSVVGKESVELFKELGIIRDEAVLEVDGVPHTMILL